jgi:CRISPR-associated protein Csd2
LIWSDFIPEDLRALYEIYEYHHAAAILKNEFSKEFQELCEALRKFRVTTGEIKKSGGNESDIPKKFSALLRPSWSEQKLSASRVVDGKTIDQDTHKIDYVKGRVALDIEWNSKDQTFDRDLYAFRTFFEYNRISVGVLVTRATEDLNDVFKKLGTFVDKRGKIGPVIAKFGASTTHVGKLLPRLEAGRNGGCPVLVFGITRKLISDWETYEKDSKPGRKS